LGVESMSAERQFPAVAGKIDTWDIHTCMHTYIHIYIYIMGYTYIHTYTCMHIWIYIYIYIWIYICTYMERFREPAPALLPSIRRRAQTGKRHRQRRRTDGFNAAHRQGRDTCRDVEPTDSMPRTDKAETQAETSNRRIQCRAQTRQRHRQRRRIDAHKHNSVCLCRAQTRQRPMDKRASVRDREKDACDRGKHKGIERLYLSLPETASPPHHSPTHNAHTRTHTHAHARTRTRTHAHAHT
jgi:hypothetical protein